MATVIYSELALIRFTCALMNINSHFCWQSMDFIEHKGAFANEIGTRCFFVHHNDDHYGHIIA